MSHAVAAHNNNVSRGTKLAHTEVHIGRYPRLPMTILKGRDVRGNYGFKRDQFDFLKLTRGRHKRAYKLVRDEDRLTKARHASANKNNWNSKILIWY